MYTSFEHLEMLYLYDVKEGVKAPDFPVYNFQIERAMNRYIRVQPTLKSTDLFLNWDNPLLYMIMNCRTNLKIDASAHTLNILHREATGEQIANYYDIALDFSKLPSEPEEQRKIVLQGAFETFIYMLIFNREQILDVRLLPKNLTSMEVYNASYDAYRVLCYFLSSK